MSATTIAGTIRYTPPGIREIYLLDTAPAATTGIPTMVELDAGTNLTPEIVDGSVTGFTMTGSTTEAGDLGSKITRKVQGRISLDDSSFALYLSEDGQDARTLFTQGDQRTIVVFPEGNHVKTPALTMDVFPVTVQTAAKDPDTTKVAQIKIDFAMSGVPLFDKPIPTV